MFSTLVLNSHVNHIRLLTVTADLPRHVGLPAGWLLSFG